MADAPTPQSKSEAQELIIRRQRMIIIGLTFFTLASAAGLGVALIKLAEAAHDDEDRPPVIVTSGGSIKIEAQEWRDSNGNTNPNYGRGYFTKDSADYAHKHDKKSPKKFEAFLVYAACAGSQDQPYKVETLDVTYQYTKSDSTTGTETFTIKTDQKDLRVYSPGSIEVDAKDKYTLLLNKGEPALLESVVLDKGTKKEIPCKFAPDRGASITVYQKK